MGYDRWINTRTGEGVVVTVAGTSETAPVFEPASDHLDELAADQDDTPSTVQASRDRARGFRIG